MTNETLAGGTFTIYGEDGEDTDGDGSVDGDGDLNNANNDMLTLTAIGTFEGITLYNSAIIDSFYFIFGPYDGSNIGVATVIATNTTSSGSVSINHPATVKGNVYVGVGGDPNDAISDPSNAISGTKAALSDPIVIPAIT